MDSPYWKWVKFNNGGVEPKSANPDKVVVQPEEKGEGILFFTIQRLVNWEAKNIFTSRQLECFNLIIEGVAQKQMAKKMGITRSAVNRLVQVVRNKILEKYYEYGGMYYHD